MQLIDVVKLSDLADPKDARGASAEFRNKCKDHAGLARKLLNNIKLAKAKFYRAASKLLFADESTELARIKVSTDTVLALMQCFSSVAKPDFQALQAAMARAKEQGIVLSITFYAASMWTNYENCISQQRCDQARDTLYASSTTSKDVAQFLN